MATHYKPYGEHYKKKKLIHKVKPGNESATGNLRSIDLNPHKRGKSILIIIDVQKDFLPGGTVPIMAHKHDKGHRECEMMINSINELILADVFDYYVFTQDAHQSGNVTLASSHKDKAPFDVVTHSNGNKQILWPDHCMINCVNKGISFSDKLIVPVNTESNTIQSDVMSTTPIIACKSIKSELINGNDNTKFMTNLIDKSYIMQKGLNKDIDCYSAFKDSLQNETGLRRFCTERKITDIYVCGLARDFCCFWSAADATTYEYTDQYGSIKKEFNVYFILDGTLPVPGSIDLPDYDPKGNSPHQLMIKRLTPEIVHRDLERTHIEGNMWVTAFLEPYGITAVSWKSTIDKSNTNKRGGGSIFMKSKVDNINKMDDLIIDNANQQQKSEIDYNFLMNIAKM